MQIPIKLSLADSLGVKFKGSLIQLRRSQTAALKNIDDAVATAKATHTLTKVAPGQHVFQ